MFPRYIGSMFCIISSTLNVEITHISNLAYSEVSMKEGVKHLAKDYKHAPVKYIAN